MRRAVLGALLGSLLGASSPSPGAPHRHDRPLEPHRVIHHLQQGNQRFVTGHLEHPRREPARRVVVAGGQRPYATVLACADSRVPPELLFDEGLGDLFVVRTAGHVVDTSVLGSIEYAVEHLHTPLVVVLGHQACGAVAAALGEDPHPGHLASLLESIRPAAELARHMGGADRDEPAAGALLQRSVMLHVRRSVEALRRRSPVIREREEQGGVAVVGAVYDLHRGVVGFLSRPGEAGARVP